MNGQDLTSTVTKPLGLALVSSSYDRSILSFASAWLHTIGHTVWASYVGFSICRRPFLLLASSLSAAKEACGIDRRASLTSGGERQP